MSKEPEADRPTAPADKCEGGKSSNQVFTMETWNAGWS
jgi:hypothetical protein